MSLSPLTIQNQRFIDSQGRQVLLHGINLVNKDSSVGYLGGEGHEFYAQLAAWGFNCLRLGVIWDGLEPQPGQYSETYLKGIDRQIELAARQGLYVFLDMHQDLYSVLFSDGAPAWATLTDDAPHIAEGIWSDAYFTSPAVQAALDNFWKNAPGPDGVGIQDRYARAWGVLAQRYGGNPAVIGYDMMNEPNPGSQSLQVQSAMFSKGAEIMAARGGEWGSAGIAFESPNPVEELAMAWLTPEGRHQILHLLDDLDLYTQVIDAVQPIYNDFEQSKLMELYRRAAAEIRAHDPDGFLFLESSMGSNMGVNTAIEALSGLAGGFDRNQVYAAHGYDLVTDTGSLAQASTVRIRLIFERQAKAAQRLGMPLLVGEWGAYGDIPGTLPAARAVVGVFEEILASETYWAYIPGIEDTDSFPAVHRPYPERVAGQLARYHYDPEMSQFTCTWREDDSTTAPTRIYLPNWFGFEADMVSLAPQADGFEIHPVSGGSGSLYIHIPPAGKRTERRLKINGRPT
jgi:endoglycosylceramidase